MAGEVILHRMKDKGLVDDEGTGRGESEKVVKKVAETGGRVFPIGKMVGAGGDSRAGYFIKIT